MILYRVVTNKRGCIIYLSIMIIDILLLKNLNNHEHIKSNVC